ncbi:FAD-dependent monooxygenase [Streptomyces sp. NPDC048111]|uniref:FAD-dependent monooxygenase n=1 Tax=Streptomyces sp. NPDC048111 TaxID=3365500 RepID=UPI00371A880F
MNDPARASGPHDSTRPDDTTAPADAPSGSPDPGASPQPGSSLVTTDVLVVGAGPTGLLLAGDLAAAGLSVTLAERRPHGISNMTRAFAVHARTLEMLDTRGLADELIKRGTTLDRMNMFGQVAFDMSRLRSRFPFMLVAPQFETEQLLERRALAAGVQFRYEHELLSLRQDREGVSAELRDATGGPAVTVRSRYAVGTDGVHSAVRSQLGLPFPGRSVIRSIVLADVRLTEEPKTPLTLVGSRDSFVVIAPFGDGYHRVMGWNRKHQVPDTEPVGLDELRAITRDATGSDHGMHDARWISRFHSDERQSPSYRVGRILLAGDAAHVHSPAGGQGMNTGLQDAANLSWKLTAVLRGHTSDAEALLDSYEAERHPVGATVLRTSGALLRIAMAHAPWQRAGRSLLVRFLRTARPAATKAMGMISGVGISYPAERGAHPLAGTRAPDLDLAEGRLYEALRQGEFVLVTARDGGDPAPEGVVGAHWRSGRTTTLLVRPDGYVAWASEQPDAAGLHAALHRWTGRV